MNEHSTTHEINIAYRNIQRRVHPDKAGREGVLGQLGIFAQLFPEPNYQMGSQCTIERARAMMMLIAQGQVPFIRGLEAVGGMGFHMPKYTRRKVRVHRARIAAAGATGAGAAAAQAAITLAAAPTADPTENDELSVIVTTQGIDPAMPRAGGSRSLISRSTR